MGLFSDRRRLFRPTGLRLPIRLHSEFSLSDRLAGAGRGLRRAALTATNDARVVAVVLLIAAAALALEMASSFR